MVEPTEQEDLSEKSKKAFDFAQETTKQLLTLATGIIAISITFSKDIVGVLSPDTKGYLGVSWLLYLFSILFGIWALMAMTGSLEPKRKSKLIPSIRGVNVTLPSALQIISFLGGLTFTVVYGIMSLCPIWPFC